MFKYLQETLTWQSKNENGRMKKNKHDYETYLQEGQRAIVIRSI